MTSQTNEFYNRLGVKRIINAASWITVYGGSIMPPAVVEAMNEASRWFIDLHELNQKAGEVIARLTGAESGTGHGRVGSRDGARVGGVHSGHRPRQDMAAPGHDRHEGRDRHSPRTPRQLRPQLPCHRREAGRDRQHGHHARVGA